MARRPDATEYAPFYEKYVRLVDEEADLGELLARQLDDTLAFYRDIPESRLHARYAPGKWTVSEVLGHVSDAERVFQYRALCIARGEQQNLPGFDQDEYMAAAPFDRRTWASLLEELKTVRAASVSLFRSFDEAALDRRGVANGNPITVRALGYIIAGHERHHLAVLKEKYL
ncbi:MAG TPA: DinB family protein [Vicinamibacterales bacterium]